MTARFISGTPVLTTGTTPIQLGGGAPGSGKQWEFLAVHVKNQDTVDHTYTLEKVVGATRYPAYPPVVIPTGKWAQLLLAHVSLDGTNQTLELTVDANATTTESRVDVAIFEVP